MRTRTDSLNMGRHQEGTITSKELAQTSPIMVRLQQLVIICGGIYFINLAAASLLFWDL